MKRFLAGAMLGIVSMTFCTPAISADRLIDAAGVKKRQKDMGDGSFADVVASAPALNTVTGKTPGVGTDYSTNKPTIPNVGSNFAASGPYASYVLLTSIPAGAILNSIDIENTSGAQIVIVRDDGTTANGAAPANASIFTLAGGAGAGQQGGAWGSTTFRGRIQIYAPSASAQVAIFVD